VILVTGATGSVADITGESARPFRVWAAEHAGDFR
jgi:hypothetical protein